VREYSFGSKDEDYISSNSEKAQEEIITIDQNNRKVGSWFL